MSIWPADTCVCKRLWHVWGRDFLIREHVMEGSRISFRVFQHTHSQAERASPLYWRTAHLFYFDNDFFLSPVGKWALNCEDENRYLSHKVLNTWHTHTQMYSITQTQMLHTNWEAAVPRSLHHGITQSLKCGRMANICSLTAKFSKQFLIILFNFYSFLFITSNTKIQKKIPTRFSPFSNHLTKNTHSMSEKDETEDNSFWMWRQLPPPQNYIDRRCRGNLLKTRFSQWCKGLWRV